MYEMFGAGTAAIVSPIKSISYQGKEVKIPLDPTDPTKQAGKLATRLADTIMGIQYGEIPSLSGLWWSNTHRHSTINKSLKEEEKKKEEKNRGKNHLDYWN